MIGREARTRPRAVGLALFVALAAMAIGASSASAVVVYGTGEPVFTKGSTNTWWFADSNVSSTDRACFTRAIDGVNQTYEGDGCTESSPIKVSHSGLLSGHQYGEVGHDDWYSNALGWQPFAGTVATVTTMDASKPTAGTSVDGSATVTNNPNMTLLISYNDSISYPWPQGSTFDCWRKNADTGACQNAPANNPNQFQFDSGCSSPSYNDYASDKSSSWGCTYDISGLRNFGDGTWYYCVIEADYAVPDVPNSQDQFTGIYSSQANLSDDTPANCGYITLDRTPPSVTASADHTTVHAGDLVNFSAQASDPSGVGGINWSFGDNTPGSAGATTSHTYTQPGTYVATASTTDGAGNAGSGQVTVTVQAPAPVSSGSGGSSGGGGSGSFGSLGSFVGNSTVGNSTTTGSVGGLDTLAPRTVKAGTRSIHLAFNATGKGTVRLQLLRGRRTLARGGRSIAHAGLFAYSLRVPRLKAGTYSLKVTFQPSHGKARTRSFRIKVSSARTRAEIRRARTAVAHPAAQVSRGAPIPTWLIR